MKAHLVLGLLLTTALVAAAAAAQPRPAEDPCSLAKRIALSPPCLAAGSACEAVDLFREAFGAPRVFPAGAELPPELEARLPDAEVDLGKLESFEDAFKRLGEASGIEVVLHPDLKDEKISGFLDPMPVKKAWRALLGAGRLLTRFDGERLLIAMAPGRTQSPWRQRVPTFDCKAR